MKLRATTLVALAAIAAATLTSCVAPRPEPERNSAGAIESSQAVDPMDIKVGDCTADIAEGEVAESIVLPCAEPHYWEAYAAAELTGDDFPEDAQDQAGALCVDQFADFIGVPYEESTYELTYLHPTAETWAIGDREVLCLVGPDGETTTGSLKGVGA
jgi:hypothetical protein